MVDRSPAALDRVFRALADPTRRSMLRELAGRERTVSELANPYRMSLAAASKHVKTLEQAGLVRRTVRGRSHYCRLDAAPLAEAQDWFRFYERFWNERLDALEALLRSSDAGTAVPERKSKATKRTPEASTGPKASSGRTRPK